MAWTTPKTDWNTGELVTAADINAIGENLAVLRQPSAAVASYTTPEDIVVNTAGEYADVDSLNMNLTVTTNGEDVLFHFDGTLTRARVGRSRDYTDTYNHIDIDIDGIRQGGDNGIVNVLATSGRRETSFTRLIQNLNPGTHTFKLQFKNWGNGVTLHAGAQFWVRGI